MSYVVALARDALTSSAIEIASGRKSPRDAGCQHDPTPAKIGLRSEETAPPLVGRNAVRAVSLARVSLLRPFRDAVAEAHHPSSHAPAPPPALAVPPLSWGCAASGDRAERRRRGRALGHSEESTTGLLAVGQEDQKPVAAAAAWRRRGCKVAPEPKEPEEPAMPDSPSFRYYCQKAAAVDALVAEAEASDGDGSVRITETSQAPKTNELTVEDTSKNKIVEVSKPKQVSKWLRFRGMAIVAAAWCNLFSRHRSKASTPSFAAAAETHPPGPVPDPAAAARSRT